MGQALFVLFVYIARITLMRIVQMVLAASISAAAGFGISAARAQQPPKAGPSVMVFKSPT
jgi:hypothetical protein